MVPVLIIPLMQKYFILLVVRVYNIFFVLAYTLTTFLVNKCCQTKLRNSTKLIIIAEVVNVFLLLVNVIL